MIGWLLSLPALNRSIAALACQHSKAFLLGLLDFLGNVLNSTVREEQHVVRHQTLVSKSKIVKVCAVLMWHALGQGPQLVRGPLIVKTKRTPS
jgi:hypothetical protein